MPKITHRWRFSDETTNRGFMKKEGCRSIVHPLEDIIIELHILTGLFTNYEAPHGKDS